MRFNGTFSPESQQVDGRQSPNLLTPLCLGPDSAEAAHTSARPQDRLHCKRLQLQCINGALNAVHRGHRVGTIFPVEESVEPKPTKMEE